MEGSGEGGDGRIQARKGFIIVVGEGGGVEGMWWEGSCERGGKGEHTD